MDAVTDTEAQARAVERDIEHTRNEMDATLSELERRLAPSEIVHQGAESVRERVRGVATDAIEAVKRHPVPVALALGLVLARYVSRPSAQERLSTQADEDLDRAWRVMSAGLTRAKEQSLEGEAKLERWARALATDAGRWAEPRLEAIAHLVRLGGEDARRVAQQVIAGTRTVRDGSSAHPLATIALLSLAAAFGARRWRSRPY
jgi:fructose-bisphosphate aldolase class 1